jgi:ABC-type glycerol-3-phosphate transport system substrate-binding protein
MSGTTATLAAREESPVAGPAPAAGRRRLTRRHGLVAFGGLSAAAMTPLLAACGAPEAAPGGSAGKVQGTVRVVWQDPTSFVGYKEVWERTFAAFQQANPGAKVEPEWIVSGDRREKILAPRPPAIPATYSGPTMRRDAQFSARKIKRPLDDLVARSKYNLGAHYPHAIEVNRYQGKLYGLPKTTHPGIAAVLYNVDAFRRVGSLRPPAAWTYADLITVAKKLSTPNSARPASASSASRTAGAG